MMLISEYEPGDTVESTLEPPCDCQRDLIPDSFLDEMRETAGLPLGSDVMPYPLPGAGEPVVISEDDYIQMADRLGGVYCTCDEDDSDDDLPLSDAWESIKGVFG